jgi:selenocysteine lyase/cysteine desulfurase
VFDEDFVNNLPLPNRVTVQNMVGNATAGASAPDGTVNTVLIRGGTGSQSEHEIQPHFAPDRYESGTLNALGIAGLGAAADHLARVGIDRVRDRLSELGRRLRDGLADADGITLNGPEDPAASVGILSLNVDGVPCATVARLLDDEWGVMTRAGLHCAPAAHRSLGTAPEGTVRLSWGADTTDDEIDVAVEALRTIAARHLRADPLRTVA